FGGGTIRTEFEVLTGLPLSSFPGLQYPYLGIESAHLRGLVSSLKHAGYRSTAVHPNKGGFWNRRNVFRQLGFDRFISEDDPAFAKAPRRGYYISDAAFTDVVLSSLAADGPPQFVFGISIEEHGPYDNVPLSADAAAARNAIPVPAGLDPASTQRLQTYLLHQRDADAQLGRLASALAQRARPSLLLFYGDHLPGLGDVYQLGFDDGRDASEQPVPYLLIEPGQPHAPTRRDLPAWMLGSTILDRAGVRNDPWFALLAAVQPALEPQHGHVDDALAHQLAAASALRLRGQ
ncbi:MAG TPA: LTA synthase family protein, partial [Rhodanobacteraceae bacterium]|nr:LTA synthase family protein [Rhodanobacteraceae bacterium]